MPSATRSRAVFRWFAAASLLAPLAGCTSAITSTYLRNMPWDGPEHAAETDPEPDATADDDAPADAAVAADGFDEADASAEAAPVDDLPSGPSREAAIEEAVTRISKLGTLSAAAQDALVETLRHTQQQDWPVVIEEFAAALAASAASTTTSTPAASAPAPPPPDSATRPAPEPAAAPEPEQAAVPEPAVAPAPTAAPATPTEPTAEAEPTVAAEASAETAAQHPVEETPRETELPAATTPLEIDNACFATRVRGWGAVDRFPADAFRVGQELIVYFELDNLSCGTSAAGHTTCIDTVLQLVDAEGHTLHRWTFEPLTETSPARRRDYFARYVLTLPDGVVAGPCRLDIAVTDALSGGSATATLPLEVAAD